MIDRGGLTVIVSKAMSTEAVGAWESVTETLKVVSALQPGHQCPHGSNRGEGSTHGAVTIVPASRRDELLRGRPNEQLLLQHCGNWWELKSNPGDIGRSFRLVEKRENRANTAGGNKSRQAGAQRRTIETIWVISELTAIALRDMKTSDSAKTRADKAK